MSKPWELDWSAEASSEKLKPWELEWDDPTAARRKVPGASIESVARDIASGALQIGPTAVKGMADIARLATGDHVGTTLSEAMEGGMRSIRDSVGSERAAAQRANFEADMADDSVGIGEALMNNKGALADQLLPTVGSMFLPVGVAAGAGKLATAGKAAQALDKAAVAARVLSVQKAAGIGTVAAQNAADTFSDLLEKGASMEDAYLGAGITVPFSVVAGKLTGGGAEAALTRALTGAGAVKQGAVQLLKATGQEGAQEAGEELGQITGEAVGTGVAPTATAALKRLAVAGTLGAAMGGGVDATVQMRGQGAKPGPQADPVQGLPDAAAEAPPPAASPAPAAAPAPVPAESVATDSDATAEEALLTPAPLTALDRVGEIDSKASNIRERLSDLSPENGYGPAFDLERQELTKEAAALAQERDSITSTWPKAVPGAETSLSTEAGVRLDARYALMDADSLVTSHDEYLRASPLYPPELQPRDRSRSASELQVSTIMQKLDPARLGVSADAATGAPIVGADGLVESGNGRMIALKRVYRIDAQKADDYRQFLRANAAQFGLAPEAVEGMAKPVLVRVRTTPVNRAEFARQANASTVQRMSPSEQALSDAKRMTSLAGLNPNEDGDFSSNVDFIRHFRSSLPLTEQSEMMESDGKLSTAGYRRIQNAVLARAYGDSPSLRRMTESMDNNLVNVSKALLRVAPTIAAARERMQAGTLHQADIATDLLAAVEGLSALKEKGWTAAQELAQTDLTGPRYSPEASELLTFLDANIRAPRRIAEFVQRYYEALEQAGDPSQPSMFGDDAGAPARNDLITKAKGAPNGNTAENPQRGVNREGAQPVAKGQREPEDAPGNRGGNQGDGTADAAAGGGQQGPAEGQAASAEQGVTVEDLSGEKINRSWTAFADDSGTLGIPRAEMPQIKAEHRGAMVNFLKARGVDAVHEEVPPGDLKPTQAEFSPEKVAQAKEFTGGDRSILVSSDSHVLDGHHQWLAKLERGEPIKAIRLDAPIAELLPLVKEFPSANQAGGATTAQDTRLSRSPDTKANYEARIDALFAGETTKLQGARVLDRSDMLSFLGLGDGPVNLAEGKVLASQDNHPHMTAAVWKKIPEWLENPALVFDSDTAPGRLVFIAPEMVNGSPVRIVVGPNATGGGVSAHLLVNAYDAQSNPFRRWESEGLLRYVDRNKYAHVSGTFQPRLTGLPGDRGRRAILTDKQFNGWRRANTPESRLRSTAQAETGMPVADVTAIAQRVRTTMPNMPKVHTLASPADAPTALQDYIREQGAWNDVEGALHQGELYLFSSGLRDPVHAEFVLAQHEAAHFGLRALLGPKLPLAMRTVFNNNPEIQRAVADLQRRGNLSDIEATEEVLVDMPSDQLAKLKGWRRVVSAIQSWLASNGFDAMAQRLQGWLDSTLSDQQRADLMAADLVRAARDYVAGKVDGNPREARGLTRLYDQIGKDLAGQEKWMTREAKARGYKSVDDLLERNYGLFEKLGALWKITHADAVPMFSRAQGGTESTDQPRSTKLSRSPLQATAAQRAESLISESAAGIVAPLDAAARALDSTARALTRGLGIERLTTAAYNRAGALLNRFTPERVKAGLISDYGVPESVIDQRTMLQGRQRVQLRKAGALIEKLSTLTRAESRVAYEWMNMDGADPQAYLSMMQGLPEESVKVLQDVQQMIDKLSQEAVRLGQLDAEAFKRNRFAYLRRSYAKHVLEQTAGEKAKRARTIAVLGEQYKGRGLSDSTSMDGIKSRAPEWWGRKLKAGKADTALKGEKFMRLERRAASGEGTKPLEGMEGKPVGKLLEVTYIPVGERVPPRFVEWAHAGTWEVRDVKGPNAIMWRDFTKAEREQMGEIDEARFAIAKTLHAMIHDVEAGRYLEWLATTQAKKEGEAIPGVVVEASERMRDTFAPSEWVRVPDTKIPGTSVLKYGKLAGRYLPGPVWNDLRQVVAGGRFKPFGETYAKVLSLWKTSKTALSPAVHMNNVMSNFVMADWHDVRAAHVSKALRILLAASQKPGGVADRDAAVEVLNRYKDSGGDAGSWVTQEIARDQIEPLLESLEQELAKGNQASQEAQTGVFAALSHAVNLRFPQAWDAMSVSKAGKGVKAAGGAMLDLYQAEDDVFRLAAWLAAKEQGATDLEAGKRARKSFLDYSINAPWINAMRASAWPFLSFTYRAVPMLLETAARKPHKLMKLMAIAGGLNALGTMLAGSGGDDEERKLLPEEKAGSIWGIVPKLIRMPWNDAHGSPVYLDIRRWIPVGDVFDVGQGHAAVPILPGLMPGGPLVLMGEVVLNKSSFTGKPITQETDTPAQKAGKFIDYLTKAFLPNILLPNPVGYAVEAATGVPDAGQTYAWTGVSGAMKGRTDAFGREMSVVQAVSSAGGVKLGSYAPDVLRRNLLAGMQAQVSEIDKNIAQLKRQHLTGRLSYEEFQELAEVEVRKQERLIEEVRKKVE